MDLSGLEPLTSVGLNKIALHVDVFLETERLLLRRFTMDDIDDVVALDGDPEVMRYISGGKPTPREEIETDHLPAWLSYYERFEGYGFWAAHEKPSGEFLGWFHFRPPPDHKPDDVELGYRLRRSAWGKGYATEASRALIDKGFRELGVRRVFASTMVVNAASRRVMEKAGLKFVRIVHREWPMYVEGDEHGETEYALTRDEWRASVTVDQRPMHISLMLAVEDAPAAADWYRRALGASELWSLGSVVGLQVAGAPFFLHEPTREGFNSPTALGATTVRVEVFLDDPDGFIARALAAGADGSPESVQDHQAPPWGTHRRGGFRDPFGHVWLVGDRSPLQPFPR